MPRRPKIEVEFDGDNIRFWVNQTPKVQYPRLRAAVDLLKKEKPETFDSLSIQEDGDFTVISRPLPAGVPTDRRTAAYRAQEAWLADVTFALIAAQQATSSTRVAVTRVLTAVTP